MRPQLFAVVSWGCAGTHWLSSALDRHPQIRCFQNLSGKMERAGGTRLDGVPYAQLLESLAEEYRAVGDCHGFGRESIKEVQAEYGDRFRCAVLVREPLARYRSQLALFRRHLERFGTDSSQGRHWDVAPVMSYARSVGVDPVDDDYSGWLVAHGANMLNEILTEQSIGSVIRMEDIVSSPSGLLELTSMLTGGHVDPDSDWAMRETSRPASTSHATSSDELTDEELDVARRIVRPEAWEAYRELGYTVSPGMA